MGFDFIAVMSLKSWYRGFDFIAVMGFEIQFVASVSLILSVSSKLLAYKL